MDMPEKQIPPLLPVVISMVSALYAVVKWLLIYRSKNP